MDRDHGVVAATAADAAFHQMASDSIAVDYYCRTRMGRAIVSAAFVSAVTASFALVAGVVAAAAVAFPGIDRSNCHPYLQSHLN